MLALRLLWGALVAGAGTVAAAFALSLAYPNGTIAVPTAALSLLVIPCTAWLLYCWWKPEDAYVRLCPQCGRIVPVGQLACGPCGYSFVQQSQQAYLPTRWPDAPVKLTLPDAEATDQQAPVADNDSAVPRRFCSHCGAQVKAGQKFCGTCGHNPRPEKAPTQILKRPPGMPPTAP